MSEDTNNQVEEEIQPSQSGEKVPPEPSGSVSKEVEEGKTFAILSYVLSFVGIPFFLVPLVMRKNEFSLYHAKQCLMLWLAGVAGSIVSSVLMVVCIGLILWIAVFVLCIVLNIIGLINATKGEMKALPLIGKWGEDWFKGLKKA